MGGIMDFDFGGKLPLSGYVYMGKPLEETYSYKAVKYLVDLPFLKGFWASYKKSATKPFDEIGLRMDDLGMHSPTFRRAFAKVPQDQQELYMRRHARAFDLLAKHAEAPHQVAAENADKHYWLHPYAEEANKEMQEEISYNQIKNNQSKFERIRAQLPRLRSI